MLQVFDALVWTIVIVGGANFFVLGFAWWDITRKLDRLLQK